MAAATVLACSKQLHPIKIEKASEKFREGWSGSCLTDAVDHSELRQPTGVCLSYVSRAEPMSLKALAFNSTLKRSGGEPSSTDRMLSLIAAEMAKSGVETEIVRLADYNILPGVTSDEGPGDDWPALRKKVLAADILIFGTPIWMGQPDSISKRVLERMDAFLGETDDQGRMMGSEQGAPVETGKE